MARPDAAKLPPQQVGELVERFRRDLTGDRSRELAAELGVPVPPAAGVGWVDLELPTADGERRRRLTGWSFPWRDGAGRVVGLQVRCRGGRKETWKNTKTGLAYLPGVNEADTLWVCEGWSDVLALASIGLAAVGRSSVASNLADVADLLSDCAAEKVVVLGERDQKADGTWPGRDRALPWAAALAAELGRPVEFAFPPGDHKDARAAVLAGWDATAWLDGVEWVPVPCPPAVSNSPDLTLPVVTLPEYREMMVAARRSTLVGTPGQVYLDRSPPGAGKSYADRELLAVAGGVLVCPTHANVREEVAKLVAAGVDAAPSPELVVVGHEQPGQVANCWNPAAKIARDLGLSVGAAVCSACPHRAERKDTKGQKIGGGDGRCEREGYQAAAERLKNAAVKVVTHRRAAVSGLANLAAGVGYLAIHEDALGVLVPDLDIDLGDLEGAELLLKRMLSEDGTLRDNMTEEQEVAVAALADVVDLLLAAVRDDEQGTRWVELPHLLPGATQRIQRRLFNGCRGFYRKKLLGVNWRGILAAVEGGATAVVVGHQFTKGGELVPVRLLKVWTWNPPPTGDDAPPCWLADGTADATTLVRLLGAVTDGTPDCRLPERTRVRQVTRDIKERSAASSVKKALLGVLADNPQWKRVGVICWKRHLPAVEELRAGGGLGARVARVAHFGSGLDRASNVWLEGDADAGPCDAVVVLGSPRKGEAAVRAHLLRTGQAAAACRETPGWGKLPWAGQTEAGGVCQVNGLGYLADPEWQAAARWLCRSALVQAVGRCRSVLPGGLEGVVVSSEECGVELADRGELLDLARGAGVARLLAVMSGGIQADTKDGHVPPVEIGTKPYKQLCRELCQFRVAELAERLQVTPRAVRAWLAVAERRGLVVPVRGGVAVPGRGRGRGTEWRLVPPAADLEGGTMATPPPELPVGVSSLALGRGVTVAETPPELRVQVADVTPSPAHTPPPPASPVPTGAATSCWWDRPLPEPPESLDWLGWALDDAVGGAVGPAEEADGTASPKPERNGRTEGGAEGRGRPQT